MDGCKAGSKGVSLRGRACHTGKFKVALAAIAVFASAAVTHAQVGGGGQDVPANCDAGASSTIRVRTPADQPLPTSFVVLGQEICYSAELAAANATGAPGSQPQCAFFQGSVDITLPNGSVARVAGPGSAPANAIDDIICPTDATTECQNAFVGFDVVGSFASNRVCYTVEAADILAQTDPLTGCPAGYIAARSLYSDGRAFQGADVDPGNPTDLPIVTKSDNACLRVQLTPPDLTAPLVSLPGLLAMVLLLMFVSYGRLKSQRDGGQAVG